MLEGLLTWNWKLWYHVNALLGFTIVIVLDMFGLSSMAAPMGIYAMVYGALWFIILLNEWTP